ncbi:MAG: cell division topological specificity factor MinE [Neisseriaceae bacterium]|jgi:cell division topological specificity factor
MALLDLLFGRKKNTANVAKERLQIILAHERNVAECGDENDSPEWLPNLQKELVEVVAKYININTEDLKINIEKRDNIELLEINVTLPEKEITNGITAL